jgi:hypothetical protein
LFIFSYALENAILLAKVGSTSGTVFSAFIVEKHFDDAFNVDI